MSIEILRAIKKEAERGKVKEVRSYVHPDVANYLLNENRPSITKLEAERKAKIIIIAEPDIHIEHFRITR